MLDRCIGSYDFSRDKSMSFFLMIDSNRYMVDMYMPILFNFPLDCVWTLASKLGKKTRVKKNLVGGK